MKPTKQRFFSVLLFLLGVEFQLAQGYSAQVFYQVLPVFEAKETKSKITLLFKGDKSGVTKLTPN
jgi:hypothetical protein